MNIRYRLEQIALPVFSALTILGTTVQAFAAPLVSTDSAIYVERHADNAMRLEPASDLAPGQRVVTILRWRRESGDGAFVITNPLPRAITYQKSSAGEEEVSIDGGRTWGRLAALRVGSRSATPEDVTHVRWRIPARLASQGRGQIAYAGIVR